MVLSILTAITYCIFQKQREEVPFTITLSWTPRNDGRASSIPLGAPLEKLNGKELDPFNQCGQRKALTMALGAINVSKDQMENIEILSSQKHKSCATLYGVFGQEQSVNARVRAHSEGDTFSHFMDKQSDIRDAVISAFNLNPMYCSKFIFTISITRSNAICAAKRAQLALDTLRDLQVPRHMVSPVEEYIKKLLEDLGDAEGAEESRIIRHQATVHMRSVK